MGSIKNVVSEPIEEHEDYHMMVSAATYLALNELRMRRISSRVNDWKRWLQIHLFSNNFFAFRQFVLFAEHQA